MISSSPITSTMSIAKTVPESTPRTSSVNSVKRPYIHFVMLLFAGLCINAAHLARKFWRFRGLGAFTNPFAFMFVVVGAATCCIPFVTEGFLTSGSNPSWITPWMADLSAIAITSIFPAIGFRSRKRAGEQNQVSDFRSEASHNPILGIMEDGVRDRITSRMQKEIASASLNCDWKTIKQAASQTLVNELAVSRIQQDEYDSLVGSINAIQPDVDPSRDLGNKYVVLVKLVKFCSFESMRRSLESVREGNG